MSYGTDLLPLALAGLAIAIAGALSEHGRLDA
jgi:hypothetical protein